MRGKRKPIEEHLKDGTFRADRHTTKALQPIHTQLPAPSDFLNDKAKEIYFIEVDFLNKNKLFNMAWLWQIEMMCYNIAIAYDCIETLKTLSGSQLVVKVNDQPQNHPTLRLMWRSYGEAHKIAMQLGITPVSFTRFKKMTEDEETSEFDLIEDTI